MKRFNPEKELYKIQHGNRNKIIFAVIALLLIISIGSTYALYQVRYSKRIIYTKVVPFSNKDLILTFLIDGKEQSNIPSKDDGYYFKSVDCEKDDFVNASWDYKNWKLMTLNASVPNKCTINFTSQPSTLIDLVNYVKSVNPELVITDETDEHNLRYVGKDPNNYIWFNCDDYTLVTDSDSAMEQHCEKWQILGLMNNVYKVNGSTENLIKIVKSDSVGLLTWHNPNAGVWATTSLQISLANYYNGSQIGTGKGINENTRSTIEEVQWDIGYASTYTGITASKVYSLEHVSPTIWSGYIALIYLSDYAYATSGTVSSSYDRAVCLNKGIDGWSASGYKENCAGNNWLLPEKNNLWVLLPSQWNNESRKTALVVSPGGSCAPLYTSYTADVQPSLYLKSNVKIKGGIGDGSSWDPYVIVP